MVNVVNITLNYLSNGPCTQLHIIYDNIGTYELDNIIWIHYVLIINNYDIMLNQILSNEIKL